MTSFALPIVGSHMHKEYTCGCGEASIIEEKTKKIISKPGSTKRQNNWYSASDHAPYLKRMEPVWLLVFKTVFCFQNSKTCFLTIHERLVPCF